jgi:hypothetical protein
MSSDDTARRQERERQRRRLAEVFGEVLPESTTDDLDESADVASGAAGRGSDARDAELLREVPPHHE